MTDKPPLKIYKNVQFVLSEEPVELVAGDQSYDIMRDAIIEMCAQTIEGRYFNHINDAAAAIRAKKSRP